MNGLTHWDQETHICVIKLGHHWLKYGLSPDLRQAIIWTNVVLLSIGPLGTNFSEILKWDSYIFSQENVSENVVWKVAAILL